jgi:deoxyribodipyrimidine photolyase-related protein
MFWVFPHQLFEDISALECHEVWLIETPLFFTQYRFHIQKIVLHRASMKAYEAYLKRQGITVRYVECADAKRLCGERVTIYDVADHDLLKSIQSSVTELTVLPSPNFLYSDDDNRFMHRFYVNQRKRLGILVEKNKPAGGAWSYDGDNRKKLPASLSLPPWVTYENRWVDEAKAYAGKFETFGRCDAFYYPVTFAEARMQLQAFLKEHFATYGDYQDAMTPEDSPLFHSMISAALNIGLLDPRSVVQQAVDSEVPLNAKEGFVRQVIGWREFMRRTYETIGVTQRTTNFFGFTRQMPECVINAATGLPPIDDALSKIEERGYAHHIERLMLLGNFFLLLEIDPDAVYEFFMRGFIDAYDWVMVGNVYGMSQFADGGLITTKPYLAGSNYILKMSRYAKGEWCDTLNALYWRFIACHGHRFASNHRMQMPLRNWERMSPEKQRSHMERAEEYLRKIELSPR